MNDERNRELTLYAEGLQQLIRDLSDEERARSRFSYMSMKLNVHGSNDSRLFFVTLTKKQYRMLRNPRRNEANEIKTRYGDRP